MSFLSCANCQHAAGPQARYCAACGQALHQHRIDSHYLWHELQHGLLHVDKGILYTAKELLRRPGRMVREFVDGRRSVHFKPVSFVIITVTVAVLLWSALVPLKESTEWKAPAGTSPAVGALLAVLNWLEQHPAVTALVLMLPVTAVVYWVFRWRTRFNYYETLILLLYLTGLGAVLRVLFAPIKLLLPELKLNGIYALLTIGYSIWGIYQFYETELPRPWQRIKRLLVALILTLLLVFVLVLLFGVLAVVVLKMPRYTADLRT